MIPGLMMPPGLMAGGGSKEITLKSVTPYTGVGSYILPAVATGDVIVVVGAVSGSSDQVATTSGFTSIGDAGGSFSDDNGQRSRLTYRIADGSEGGMDIRTVGVSDSMNHALALIFGYGAVSAIAGTPVGINSNSTPANITIPLIGIPAPAIAIGVWGSSSQPTSAAASPAFDEALIVFGPSSRRYVGYAIYNNGPGANIVMSMSDHGNANHMLGNYLLLS